MPNKKHTPIRIQCDIRADSYNETDNTIDMVFTTGQKGLRRLWDGTQYYERLEVSEKAIRMERLKLGAPLLDSHMDYSLNSIIGITGNPRIENGQGVVTVRLATRPEVQGIIQDIRAGIIKNVSVGYKKYAYTEVIEPSDGDIPLILS